MIKPFIKFKKDSESPSPTISGDVRVEEAGRFGNYFFTTGWFEGFKPEEGAFEYRFSEYPEMVVPESTFYRADRTVSTRTRFLHLFWVKGGHKLEVGPSCPMSVTVRDTQNNEAGPGCSVEFLAEGDFDVFLPAIDATGAQEIWGNRMVFELMRHVSPADRTRYLAMALERVGWRALDEQVSRSLAAKSWENTSREYLDFQCSCIAQMEIRHLPAALRAMFIDLVQALEISEGDRRLAHDIIRQLTRLEPDLACEFAHDVITTLPYDRDQLAAALRHCFPQNSQWWIQHALLTPGLGPEQAADALNCAGTAAAMEGNVPLAKLSYEVALIIDPEARSAAWNAGWLWAGLGDVEKAEELFKKIGRHYPHTSLSTHWPHVNGMPWPAAPADASAFTLPPGVVNWPRITVVTPSFNQGCFIEETLLSVLNQGYPNLQYILVDGNSTDETRDVLERYRNRLDHLIIESDNGQTEAINKGLRLADGELVAWLNSDDMYAPGTLHAAALRWLSNQADVIAGICVEHVERRIRLFNRPAATNTDFNLPQLARIFKYWFNGYYFYQPEAFFSKAMLDKVGLLDQSLYYSMDYELWMRFAKAGATLNVVDWPFAFFRKHAGQKTSAMIDSVEEQARVRDQHVTLVPDELRTTRLMRMLDTVRRKKQPVLAVCSSRMGISVCAEALREAQGACRIIAVEGPEDQELAAADVILLIAHGPEDLQLLERIRRGAPEQPVIGWLLGHHEHMFESHEIASSVDFVIPAYSSHESYLRNDQAIQGMAVPPCVFRWAGAEVEEWFLHSGGESRSAVLHGEFEFPLPDDGKVRGQVEQLAAHLEKSGFGHQFTFSGIHHADCNARESFERRCGHVASLVLPSHREIPAAIFDSLLAGQIPLVPEECKDLVNVISLELQESLPVLRYWISDASSLVEACKKASECHSRQGMEGIARRHRHALENHLVKTRIASILEGLDLP